jgi:glycosyltransferase involved in cell wall biosynthesis
MGKKTKNDKRTQKKIEKKQMKNYKPFVSVCTPTFNRRPFIESMIKCYQHQDYPQDKMEWIIIDDGTDPIEDLMKDIPGVKYFKYDEKMTLGKKRNLMHDKSKGEIIVYMDDDDYYPPTRVSHAVTTLLNNKTALCAGSSEIYIWFSHIEKMFQFGPYAPKHATAGTFAFKRELLNQTSYDETASLAEEKAFLKNYTIPFVQLNPKHSILVFSHNHNTFDKKNLLENRNEKYVKESEKTVDYFIKEQDLKDFYMNKINDLIDNYKPGEPVNKPDVIRQTEVLKKERTKKQNESVKISFTMIDGTLKDMNLNELNEYVNGIKNNNINQTKLIDALKGKLKEVMERNNTLESDINNLNIQLKQMIDSQDNSNGDNIVINIDDV